MGSFNLSVMSQFYGLFKSDILLHLAKSINHFLEYLETDSVPDSSEEILTFLTITCQITKKWFMVDNLCVPHIKNRSFMNIRTENQSVN